MNIGCGINQGEQLHERLQHECSVTRALRRKPHAPEIKEKCKVHCMATSELASLCKGIGERPTIRNCSAFWHNSMGTI